MPRKPIRSRKIVRPQLSDFVRILLMEGHEARHIASVENNRNGNNPKMTGKAEAFRMAKRPLPGGKNLLQEAWETHKDEILADWKAKKRRGLPWAAKQFDGKRT